MDDYDSDDSDNFIDEKLLGASVNNDIVLIKYYLIVKDANPNIFDGYGITPLIYAAMEEDDNTDILELLLDNDAKINERDNSEFGNTALMTAALYNFNNSKSLLERGADPFLVNKKGNTAYDNAIQSDNMEIARLIKNHIDLQMSQQMSQQNLAFMKYFLDRDDLDIDTASRIFGNEQSYNPEVNIRMMDERRRDPLTKSKQRLATMRGIRDNHSVLQYLREPELMRNVDSYLTSMRPYPSVHSRMMLEDKKGGNKRRKYYTRIRY